MNTQPKKPRSKGYSRRKGVTGEIEFMNKFKEEFNFPLCKTSRNASKVLDDCGVDLANIPLNVQIKCGYEKSRPKFDKIFTEMDRCLRENLLKGTPQIEYPKVLIHKLNGKKSENIGVTMMWDDWKDIYKGYLKYLESIK